MRSGAATTPLITKIAGRPVARRAVQITFEAPFSHVAGQYVALSATIGGSPAKAYYSIASPPRGNGQIDLCIRPDTAFAQHLLELQPGAAVACSEPAGKMRLLDPNRPAIYIAAGTGVAPMRAILLAHLEARPNADITFLLGDRSARDLAYRSEFEDLEAQHAAFRFWPSVTRENESWTGRRGHVTTHLEQAFLDRGEPDVYFCGPQALVAELRERLESSGIPDERQVYERY